MGLHVANAQLEDACFNACNVKATMKITRLVVCMGLFPLEERAVFALSIHMSPKPFFFFLGPGNQSGWVKKDKKEGWWQLHPTNPALNIQKIAPLV